MQQVRSRIDGPIGIIELHNPPDQFMTTRMVEQLDLLTEQWEADPTLRVIVITGTKPGTFITHFSVHELARGGGALALDQLPAPLRVVIEGALERVDASHRLLEQLPSLRKLLESSARPPFKMLLSIGTIHRVFTRLERMDKVVIAAINGTAMGGGCELALACDYRLMARGDHAIGLVEVLGGIIPGAGGTQRLCRAVGAARAREMMLDGTTVSPDEAERIGLVTRAVDADELMDEAMTLARRMATRPRQAVLGVKRAVAIGATLPADDGLAVEKLSFLLAGAQSEALRRAKDYVAQFSTGKSARAIFDELRAQQLP
ncbi:MAG TPA: enoyl-CoA hydratase/isomerase family protein [Polyangiales bacterium]|nr:enoyl-CoA hydratase/isomerase family protein [Polyangiales bacterium]